MDVDAVAERSMQRIAASMPEDSRLVDTVDGQTVPLCPWCESPLEVRLTTLSPYDGERGIYNDEVYLKHAGDDGCAWLPLFHTVIDANEYDRELERRGGQKRVDVATDRDDPDAVETRLKQLGYIG